MDQKEKLVEGKKLINALSELSKENFSVSDDTILDKLYVHIEQKALERDFLDPLLSDICTWLECVLKQWYDNILCGGVKVFLIRLIGLLGSKPTGFTMVNHILPEIEKLISSSEVQNDSSLMVPLLNDLAVFSNHEEGFDWVLKTGVWKYAVKALFEDRSIYINRSGVKFISLVLSKVGNYNKEISVEILKTICEPLVGKSILTIKPLPDLEKHEIFLLSKNTDINDILHGKEVHIQKKMARAVKYLCDILDIMFLSGANLPVKLQCELATNLISTNCPSPQDQQAFFQLLVMLELSNTQSSEIPREDTRFITHCPIEPLYRIMYWVIQSLMSQGHWYSLLDLCAFCFSKIHHLRTCMPQIHKLSRFRDLENMLVYQLKMFLELHSSCFGGEPDNGENYHPVEEDKDSESRNYFDDVCLEKFNEVRLSQTLSFQCFQLGIFATTRSLNYLNFTSSSETIVSLVIKSINTITATCWSGRFTLSSSLLHLITLASNIVEKYSKQSQEERIFPAVIKILKTDTHEPRITINTLQLLKKIICVQIMPIFLAWKDVYEAVRNDFVGGILEILMPPTGVMLMNNLKNQSSWEIRDTTLEVFQLVVDIVDITPTIFDTIRKNKMYQNIHKYHTMSEVYSQVLEIAAKDGVAYVRASAFKFFSKATRAKLFLDKLPDLSDVAVKTLLEDEMPEPRMAACDLLSAMYGADILLDKGMQEKHCEAVYIASMKELDWEVKKATLRFWQCTITKLLGDEKVPWDPVLLCFPSVIRSENDIVTKIIRVMDTLSDSGCFKVIWLDVNDESDISVSLEASHIIKNIHDLDRKWNFIDVIINNIDMEMDEVNLSNRKLKPKDFFTFIRKKDWRDKLEARKNWIENTCDDLSSLLDHILNPDNSMGDLDYNAVDCY